MKEKLKVLLEKRENIITQQRSMLDKAEVEKREFTAEETTQYEAMDADFEKLTTDITNLESEIRRHNERRAAAADRQRLMGGTRPNIGPEMPVSHSAPTPASQQSEEIRALHSRAFNRYLTYGERARYTDAELRALQADKDVIGGFLVAPEQFQLELIKAVDNSVYMRQICRVFTVAKAASLGAPTLENDPAVPQWTSEIKTGNEDSTMSFGKRDLHPHPLAKRIKCSKKLLEVSLMPVENIIRDRFAYQFSVTQENAFLNGNGVNQPLGVFTASADGISTGRDVSTGNTTTLIKADGLIEAKYTLKQNYMANARWIFHRDAVKQIRKLKDGEGNYLWQSGIAQDRPATILDNTYLMSEYAPSTFTTTLYVGIIGDFSHYWIADAMGMSIQVLTELYAESNQNGYIARLECDGMPTLEEAFVRVKLA